jgi:spore germination protein GerM
MATRKHSEGKPNSNAGTVFWLAAIVIVLFIFALNWGKVQETLARTNFHEIIKTQNDGDAAKVSPKAEPLAAKPGGASTKAPIKVPPASAESQGEQKTSVAPAPQVPQATSANLPENAQPRPSLPTTAKPKASVKPASASSQEKDQPSARLPASAQTIKTRPATLFFVRIDDDGVIVRQEVTRQITVSDSPLLDSLAALLKGPSEAEIRKKLISLVPAGTKLLSAQVRGSTAFLNFNEAFMYNRYGIEGYAGQLKQVVYTATSFPTVQDVQILIEGEKHDYLGGEGVFIGKPLSRNSF